MTQFAVAQSPDWLVGWHAPSHLSWRFLAWFLDLLGKQPERRKSDLLEREESLSFQVAQPSLRQEECAEKEEWGPRRPLSAEDDVGVVQIPLKKSESSSVVSDPL